jgi:hypothetical protein
MLKSYLSGYESEFTLGAALWDCIANVKCSQISYWIRRKWSRETPLGCQSASWLSLPIPLRKGRPSATMSIGKTIYYRGRLDGNCRVIEVNLTLSVMAISRGFEKFTYYRAFCCIEGRTTEVVLYLKWLFSEQYDEIVYFISSTESGIFRCAFKFHLWGRVGHRNIEFHVWGKAEHVLVCFTYEPKPSTGIIGASARKSPSVQVTNDTSHNDAKLAFTYSSFLLRC